MRPAIIPHAKHYRYLVSPGRCTAARGCLKHLRCFFEEIVHASGAGTARSQEVSLRNVIDISGNVATMQDVQAWLRTRFAGKARKSSFVGLSLHSVGAEFRKDTGSILSCKQLGFKKRRALFTNFPHLVRVDTSTARLYGVHKSMKPSVLSRFTTVPEVSTPTKKKKKGAIPSDTRSIGVWWDIENCAVRKSSIDTIGNSIRNTLHNLQLHGSVIIRAFGTKLSQGTVSRLAKTGVVLKHVPDRVKNASDAALLKDLLQWALDNPTPSHVTIISGDHYYAKALSSLKSRGYNTMLIRPRDVAKILLESVNYSLYWSDVALNKKIVA